MAEIKNTFIKSKMNKDLDSRLLPQGEYRQGINISVSTSEGADVGALENIRGNLSLLRNLFFIEEDQNDYGIEIIGCCPNQATDKVYLFLTNFNDTTAEQDGVGVGDYFQDIDGDQVKVNGTHNFIIEYNILNQSSKTLVEGIFLNFSKTAPIIASNIIEEFMFWTDNRNQPRKINLKRASANLNYYNSEDSVSVAKYSPHIPISFVKNSRYYRLLNETGLTNEADQFLAPFVSTTFNSWNTSPGIGENGDVMKIEETTAGNNFWMLVYNNLLGQNYIFEATAIGSPYEGNRYSYNRTRPGLTGASPSQNDQALGLVKYWRNIKVNNATKNDGDFFVNELIEETISATGQVNNYLGISDTTIQPSNNLSEGSNKIQSWDPGDVLTFSLQNPNWKQTFFTDGGDDNFLEDKFVRFSYRFKYDDNEYSLMAPFSQVAFIPKQDGFFMFGDSDAARDSGILSFVKNQVTTVDIKIPLENGITNNNIKDTLKVKEVEILMKESDGLAVQVVKVLNREEIEKGQVENVEIVSAGLGYTTTGNKDTRIVTGKGNERLAVTVNTLNGSGGVDGLAVGAFVGGENYSIGDEFTIEDGVNPPTEKATGKVTEIYPWLMYKYQSTKPIRVLDEKEITRVSDIIPIKALAQESVGGRIVYGNFLQNLTTPVNIDFSVVAKNRPASVFNELENLSTLEYPSLTLKQNRTYKVGLVLYDRYGRASNVITGTDGASTLNTITNGGDDPLNWFGDCLEVDLNEQIPFQRTPEYSGIYNKLTNPLGWYSYRFVVQQKEQEYYNLYVGGTTSGILLNNPTEGEGTDAPAVDGEQNQVKFINGSEFGYISIFGDNINKLPRDLSEAGPQDKVYGSSKRLWNRLYADESVLDEIEQTVKQPFKPKSSEVTDIKPFRELGDWTNKRGVDISKLSAPQGQMQDPAAAASPYFAYPGRYGKADPMYKAQENPFIALLKTPQRYGFPTDPLYSGYANGFQNGDSGAENVSGTDPANGWSFSRKLNVYEVEPFVSNIDIFYETSTTGLISDLNLDLSNVESIPKNLDIDFFNFFLNENDQPGSICSTAFQIVYDGGTYLNENLSSITLANVLQNGTSIYDAAADPNDPLQANMFTLLVAVPGQGGANPTSNQYVLQYFNNTITNNNERLLWYGYDSVTVNNFTFVFRLEDEQGTVAYVQKSGSLSNNIPSIGQPYQFFCPPGLTWSEGSAGFDERQNTSNRPPSNNGTFALLSSGNNTNTPWAYRKNGFNNFFPDGGGVASQVGYPASTYSLWDPDWSYFVKTSSRWDFSTPSSYNLKMRNRNVRLFFDNFTNGSIGPSLDKGCRFQITYVKKEFGRWERGSENKWAGWHDSEDNPVPVAQFRIDGNYGSFGNASHERKISTPFDWRLLSGPRNEFMSFSASTTVTDLPQSPPYVQNTPNGYEQAEATGVTISLLPDNSGNYPVSVSVRYNNYETSSDPNGGSMDEVTSVTETIQWGYLKPGGLARPAGNTSNKSYTDEVHVIVPWIGGTQTGAINQGFKEMQTAKHHAWPNKLGRKNKSGYRGACRWIVKVGMFDASDSQGNPGSGSKDDPTEYQFCVQVRRKDT